MKQLIKYFLQGLLYTVPLTITVILVYRSVTFVDDLIPMDFPGCRAWFFIYPGTKCFRRSEC